MVMRRKSFCAIKPRIAPWVLTQSRHQMGDVRVRIWPAGDGARLRAFA